MIKRAKRVIIGKSHKTVMVGECIEVRQLLQFSIIQEQSLPTPEEKPQHRR